jgi:hypothetical protein
MTANDFATMKKPSNDIDGRFSCVLRARDARREGLPAAADLRDTDAESRNRVE